MQRTLAILFFILLMPQLTWASLVLECKKYPFLKKGFNLNNHNQCRKLLNQCPKNGPVLDLECVKKTVKENHICYQTEQLAKSLHASADTITVSDKNRNNFMLVDQIFIADGQHSYYFITPKNCLINTKIDPRNLSVGLKKQFKNTPFVITNWGAPQFKTNIAGKRRIITTLKVTKTCIACEVVGFAKVRFDFNNDGRLYDVRLIDFSKNE